MGDPLETTIDQKALLARVASERIRLLTLVSSPNATLLPKRFPLDGRSLVIGRDPGAGGARIDDNQASRMHAELSYVDEIDRYRVKDLDSRNGTALNGRRLKEEYLGPGDVVRVGASLFVYDEAAPPRGRPIPDLESLDDVALRRALAESAADLAAKSKLPILILGPSGAGKEVLAKRIHEASGRKGGLVAVNCSTFSRDLIGSELFGHTAGAFSGAKTARSGLFVAADEGTLFLDEIAELPLEQQPSLLRALQEEKVRPVGADAEISVDVRIIAATHQSLDALKDKGAFRADLYARLAGFVVVLPGLSDRRDEVLSLFAKFIGRPLSQITLEAAEALLLYQWPLNVRELKHAAEHALLYAGANPIEIGHLPDALHLGAASTEAEDAPDQDEPTKEELIRLLEEHDGNVAHIARIKRKHRAQVYRWLRRHGIAAEKFRDD